MTFFSGTDTATLKEEGLDRNHFVSLIVNNAGSYTAGITRRVSIKRKVSESFNYPSFQDTLIEAEKTYEEEVTEIQWFNLDINVERKINYVQEELTERLEEIIKDKKAKEVVSLNKRPGYTSNYFSDNKVYRKSDIYENALYGDSSVDYPIHKDILPFEDSITTKKNYKKEKVDPFKDVVDPFENSPYRDESKEEYDSILPYGIQEADESLIKSLALQLITGSIIIPNESKVDIEKWAKGMVPLYKRRFGEGDTGMNIFKTWAESYIGFLCYYTEEDNLSSQGYTDDEITALIAYDLICLLDTLPENDYINMYQTILNDYIL